MVAITITRIPSIRACGKSLTRTIQRRSSSTISIPPNGTSTFSASTGTRKIVPGTRQRAKTTTTKSSLRAMRTHTGQRKKATLADESASAASISASRAASGGSQRNLGQELVDVVSAILRQPRTIPIPRWITPKYYTITYSEFFGHASFILVAASYALDDFLWLRIIAVAGSTSMLVFTYFHPHGRVLWLPFKWNVLFIAINSYRIGKVFWDRYLAEQLTDEMRHTRSKHFYLMDPVDFGRLARIGTVEVFRKGDVVTKQGAANPKIRLVLSGRLMVLRNEKITYRLSEGNFISECGLHAGLMLPETVDSCCTVVADSDIPVRVLTWDRTELMDLMNRSDGLKRSLKAVMSWDIIRKLKAQRHLLAEGIIDDPEEWTHRRKEQGEHRYTAILKNLLSTCPENMTSRKEELTKYRTIHHIDDEYHRQALKECGWTVEEFEAGYKPDYDSHDVYRPSHGMDWYIREAISRIIG